MQINDAKIYRYIKKPWEPSELLMIVRAAAEYYQLKQENDRLVYDLNRYIFRDDKCDY